MNINDNDHTSLAIWIPDKKIILINKKDVADYNERIGPIQEFLHSSSLYRICFDITCRSFQLIDIEEFRQHM